MHQGRQANAPWRARLQLVGAVMFAVALPMALRYGMIRNLELNAGLVNTALATLLAVLFGHIFFQRIVKFPGSSAAAFILPIFLGTYGAMLAILFFLRLDYSSRLHLSLSFVACVTWYHICYVLERRARPRRYGVVPGGQTRDLPQAPRLVWIPINSPSSPIGEVDGIVADFRADLPDEWERFVAEQAIGGTPIYHVKQAFEAVSGRVQIEHLSENSLGSLIPGLAYPKIKFLVDIAFAAAGMIVLAVPLAIIAIVIRLDSPGPALFRQQRMGYRGRVFTVFKFRTMAHRSHEGDARENAMTRADDHRITGLGRFLRHTRLDELPQIINIVRGEMSWIGPRPEAVVLSHWYETEIPFYRYRHIVRPGISGWAQVNQGHVAELADVLGKLHYDFYYIKYHSATLDFLILLRTIATVLTGFGAK